MPSSGKVMIGQERSGLDIHRLGEPSPSHPYHQGKRGAPRLRELDPLARIGRIMEGQGS